jgi:hypothetical protein
LQQRIPDQIGPAELSDVPGIQFSEEVSAISETEISDLTYAFSLP